jgi:hypothetical protein
VVTAKITAILAGLGLYFGCFVFGPWYDNMPVQALVLATLLAGHIWLSGLDGTKRVLGFTLPFVLSLLVFGAVFQWMELLGRSDWLWDSLLKALVFPASVLTVKIGLEAITFGDILALPLPGSFRRAAIVLKAVMEKCTPILHRYRFFMELCPHFSGRRGGKLMRLCGVIIAAYLSIYEQTEKTRILFDHRIHHLRNTQ